MTRPQGSPARFDIGSGPLRGTTLTLYDNALEHRGADQFETIPLAAIAAVRIGFERDARLLNRAGALVVIAVLLLVFAGPLGSIAASLADEVTVAGGAAAGTAGGQGMGSVLLATFRGLGQAARLFPVAGGVLAALGAVLAGFGWWGYTTLTLTLAAIERDYSVRGRNTELFDFAERICERIGSIAPTLLEPVAHRGPAQ